FTATDEQRAALLTLLDAVDELGLDSAAGSAGHWRRVLLHLDQRHLRAPDGFERSVHHRSLLPLGGGAVLALTEHNTSVPDGHEFGALLHDPTGRFAVPGPYTLRGEAPLGDRERAAGWLRTFLDAADEHGPVPFRPEAAEEFARLTGVSGTLAKLVVAGLPHIDDRQHHFLPAPLRTALGVKSADADHARDELRELDADVRREVVAALLPADPERLWSDGPDAAAAAQVWNLRVGRRTPVPDWLLTEAARAVNTGWSPHRALAAVVDPAASPELSADVPWRVKGDRAEPSEPAAAPFTTTVLTGALCTAAWLAHRLPAGDPVRAALPPVLTALRQRLAAPELLLLIGYYTDIAEFRKAAGTPTETVEGTDGYERYGAVILPTHDDRPMPVLRPTLLDSTGRDPYLPLLRGTDQQPSRNESALRLVHDPAFAALLADPGAPAAGGVDADGTWWPQDPSRSVPDLVAEATAAHGLGADAAALYLMLLAMPDPTDRNTARWTGWKPARLKAARAELAATDLVVEASRSRAGRSLFLPGGWSEQNSPVLPVEQWKLPMYEAASVGQMVPAQPVADLYRRAWQRVREGDTPRFEELKV
ncbi:DNA-binding protein, partial [Streptomyces sp. NPDC059835]